MAAPDAGSKGVSQTPARNIGRRSLTLEVTAQYGRRYHGSN